MSRPKYNQNYNQQPKEFDEKVLELRRTSKKNQGGNKIGFSALVVVGNKNGRVGTGLGKANDVSGAVQRALTIAKKNMVSVNLKDSTIGYSVEEKYGSAKVLLKPAPQGSGIIAGGAVRAVVELAGVKDISAKMLGSSNKMCNVICTIEALKKLKA